MPCGPQCRCCILGICCPPPEQRAMLRAWLLENFSPPTCNEQNAESYVDGLLDDLFQDVKLDEEGKVIATTTGEVVLGDGPTIVTLEPTEEWPWR